MTPYKHIPEDDLVLFEMGVLSADEAAKVRAHLAECDACAAALQRAGISDAMLAFALRPETPSNAARDKFLAALKDSPAPAASNVVAFERPPARRSALAFLPAWSLGLAAAVFLVAAVVLFTQNRNYARQNQAQLAEINTQQQQLQIEQKHAASAQKAAAVLATLQAPDTARFLLTSSPTPPQPQIRTFFRKSTGQIVLIASKLPSLPAGKTYELWFIGKDGKPPVPAGTFAPDAQGNVTASLSHVKAGGDAKQFAVTVENEGGSDAPTSAIVFSGSQGE
jgi:anti-sigma-K factor RskA